MDAPRVRGAGRVTAAPGSAAAASSADARDLRARVLRNGSLNVAGAVAPLLIGIVAIPAIVRGLGVDRFGVLSLAWAVLGYFSLFDLGLGRATTRFVASLVGTGQSADVPPLVWSSTCLSAVLGVAGALLLAAATPPLVGRVLNLSPDLVGDARRVFWIVAATLPAVLVSNTLRGVLEGHQRFGLVNAVAVPASAAMFLLPALGVAAGLGLPALVALLAASRFAAAAAFAVSCVAFVPGMRRRVRIDVRVVRPLLTYGGWVTLSNAVGSILTYIDRFAIGAVLSSAEVGYYTAPYDTVTRLWVIPSSVVGALFPAVSASSARREHTTVSDLAGPPIKYMLLLVGPVVGVLIVYAPEILGAWLGPSFASRSSLVLQLLAVGVLFNCVAFVPFSVLQAVGRADLPPKFYVAELALYLPLLLVLLERYGIAGAAAAWAARVGLDCIVLGTACGALSPFFRRSLRDHGVFRAAAAVFVLWSAIALARVATAGRVFWQIPALAVIVLAFTAVAWSRLLTSDERDDLLSFVRFGRIAADRPC